MKPKRYKLKKDLPTFKAGEIFEIYDSNLYKVNETDEDTEFEVMAYHKQTLERFPNILTEWFEEIKPAEPLIKDEKIRKAVRAWAEVNAIRQVGYVESLNRDSCCISDIDGEYGDEVYSIKFVGWIPTLKDCGEYTIAELCGEEGE